MPTASHNSSHVHLEVLSNYPSQLPSITTNAGQSCAQLLSPTRAARAARARNIPPSACCVLPMRSVPSQLRIAILHMRAASHRSMHRAIAIRIVHHLSAHRSTIACDCLHHTHTTRATSLLAYATT
ncbi:hypothetical protein Salat_2559800 [Sesamum alatum]|uniref:Uncharacterized protein n=1 Tax=Sesamum alatum TaxID=300844 RepID=A0AAE1XTI0_9LAMI|nr:hypothetical protein Salat_2559800 [Sesamum alatum]